MPTITPQSSGPVGGLAYTSAEGHLTLFHPATRNLQPVTSDALPFYSWSPDAEQIAFDTLIYYPNGSERIWISPREGTNETPFSLETGTGYAFHPLYSPQGEAIAYFQEVNGPESGQYHLFIQAVTGGEPRNLDLYSQVSDLSYSPDGKYLVLTSGPYEGREIIMMDIASTRVEALARGSQAVWQPSADSGSD